MSRVYHTADWHIGHKNILKYRPMFKSIEEHNNTLFDNYKSIIKKRDTVYFHGDMCFDKEQLYKFEELVGRKILILGNHDTEFVSTEEFLKVFDKVIAVVKRKGFWLTHIPIHHEELRGKFNIHGHTHNFILSDKRYINVCVDICDFKPVNLEVIKELVKDLR